MGQERKKKEVRSPKSDHDKHESVDVNANHSSENNMEPVAFSNASSNSFISLVSHWYPHSIKSFQQPSSISSMVTHCALSPPPENSLLSMSEVLEALNKAVEKLSESMEVWGKKN